MKILIVFVSLIVAVIIGGFGFFAFMDMPVHQQDVSREIPAERFMDN